MKITKSILVKVSAMYSLGDIVHVEPLPGGLRNYNYVIQTQAGTYVLRFFSTNTVLSNKKHEFLVLGFLNKKKWKYHTPNPIPNKQNRIISTVNGKKFYICKKLPGKPAKSINIPQTKSLARALASYHNVIKSLKVKSGKKPYAELLNNLLGLRKINPQNKTDELMKASLDMFISIAKKARVPNKHQICCHGDLSWANALFKGNSVVSVLDFDNMVIAPRIYDLGIFLQRSSRKGKKFDKFDKRKFSIVLEEYKKYAPLTKKEQEYILDILLLENGYQFWWFYAKMEKEKQKRHSCVQMVINRTKDVLKNEKEDLLLN